MPEKLRILILCTGNSCRSQMAEGLFRYFGEGSVDSFSAGLDPKGVNPRAVTVMNELGIDISSHTSDHLEKYLKDSFDFVITVCDNANEKCPVFPGAGKRLHWPFDDPADATGTDEEILAEFRRVRDEIAAKVRAWLESRTF
ncbi:arsenate reductase ArsC [bacterium]|nr:arsenate reductase ArsC [bacterium]